MVHSVAQEFCLLLFRILTDVGLLLGLICIEIPRRMVMGVLPSKEPKCVPPDGKYKHVLITGASVGIGAGLARQYASPGTLLTLTAYNKPSLDKTIKDCVALGARVDAHYIDVKDKAAMRTLIETAHKEKPLDLVIANAGVVPTKNGLDQSEWVIETNVGGVLATVLPAIECFRKQGRGQLVIMSSVGSYACGTNVYMLPYVASKGAIRLYGESLRLCLAEENIGVTVVCPGFVESRMTVSQARLGVVPITPWKNEEACSYIREGINSNQGDISFPLPLYVGSRIAGNLPPFIKEMLGSIIGMWDPFANITKTLENVKEGQHKVPDVVGLNDDQFDDAGGLPTHVIVKLCLFGLVAGFAMVMPPSFS